MVQHKTTRYITRPVLVLVQAGLEGIPCLLQLWKIGVKIFAHCILKLRGPVGRAHNQQTWFRNHHIKLHHTTCSCIKKIDLIHLYDMCAMFWHQWWATTCYVYRCTHQQRFNPSSNLLVFFPFPQLPGFCCQAVTAPAKKIARKITCSIGAWRQDKICLNL